MCLFLRRGEVGLSFLVTIYLKAQTTPHYLSIAQNGRIPSNSKVSDNHHRQLLDLASCKVWPFVGDSRSCFWFDLSDTLLKTLLCGK